MLEPSPTSERIVPPQKTGPQPPTKKNGSANPQGPESVRWLWKEEATEAVLDFLGDARVRCRVSPGRARVDESRDEEVRRRGGLAGPALGCIFLGFFLLLSFLCLCTSFPLLGG